MGNLDSNKAFEGILRKWKFAGLSPIEKQGKVFSVYSILVNIIVIFVMALSLTIEIFVEDDLGVLMNNLSTTITIIALVMKHWTLFFCTNNFRNVKMLLEKLDQRIADADEAKCIEKALKFCASLFKVYNFVYYTTIFFLLLTPFFAGNNRMIFAGWFPFDVTVRRNYWVVYVYEGVGLVIMGVLNLALDIYAPIYILVVTAHIEVISLRISRIGKIPGAAVSSQLVECVEDYLIVLRLFDEISQVIQRTLFIQFFVTGFVLCIAAVNLLFFAEHVFEIIGVVMYLGALILEVFPACYCMNRLMEYNSALTGSLYNCNWVGQDLQFQKSLIIFMQRTQKNLVMSAGNIVPIGLATFMGIIKFSFSMFTLLSQLNK